MSSLTRKQIFIFAIASGASVANVYYAQPLLGALAIDFHISYAAVGGVITFTQIGSILALIFLVPIGDYLNRRFLMLTQVLALIFALILVSLTTTPALLFAAMLSVGLLGTAMTQGLIAFAASSASIQEQGHVIGSAQSGVFIGLLLARVVSGGISDLTGWRGVYIFSAALMLIIYVLLRSHLPNLTASQKEVTYKCVILSMFTLLRQDKVLQLRGAFALLMFAAFNVFWNALVLLLSAPPYNYSYTIIGAFGLVGLVGAVMASWAGRWSDKGYGAVTTLSALVILLAAWLPLALAEKSLLALIVGILLLDTGGQALHVTNQGYIFKNSVEEHSRKVSLYMLYYAVGSGIGAVSTTYVYSRIGWSGVCLLGSSFCLIAIMLWIAAKQSAKCDHTLCP